MQFEATAWVPMSVHHGLKVCAELYNRIIQWFVIGGTFQGYLSNPTAMQLGGMSSTKSGCSEPCPSLALDVSSSGASTTFQGASVS